MVRLRPTLLDDQEWMRETIKRLKNRRISTAIARMTIETMKCPESQVQDASLPERKQDCPERVEFAIRCMRHAGTCQRRRCFPPELAALRQARRSDDQVGGTELM